ncbi:MAG TPA: DinB family protein [Thermoanaerobaculia bacterium]|jgi:hypothetical protein|nr:DinB family protein [Thermoanaerobaculia bacterium]
MQTSTPLLPEQERALGYIRKRGTEAALEAIRGKVAGTYAEFEALVETIPAAVAAEHRSTSGWSIHEVVDHLVQSDGPAVHQLAQLLAGQSLDTPIPASLQSPNPFELDWDTLRREFRRIHQDILGLLTAASDDVPITATAPVQMVVKCAGPDGSLTAVSWVERFDWKAYAILLHAHNREHIAQVNRILNAPAAR